MLSKKITLLVAMVILVITSLACSAGTLLVRAPQTTPTLTKTPRPTFTPTLIPTETPTPTLTPTNTPIPTETPTLPVTETPTEPPPPTATNTPVPAAPQPTKPPAAPAEPTQPPAPTNTPAPSYACQPEGFLHPTGSAGQTRFTALVWKGDRSTGYGNGQAGYQLKVVGPTGEFLSEVSGPGSADSSNGGDNHPMNMKVEIPPYTPGVYTVSIVKDGQPFSAPVEFNFTASPMQYAHIQCILPN